MHHEGAASRRVVLLLQPRDEAIGANHLSDSHPGVRVQVLAVLTTLPQLGLTLAYVFLCRASSNIVKTASTISLWNAPAA